MAERSGRGQSMSIEAILLGFYASWRFVKRAPCFEGTWGQPKSACFLLNAGGEGETGPETKM